VPAVLDIRSTRRRRASIPESFNGYVNVPFWLRLCSGYPRTLPGLAVAQYSIENYTELPHDGRDYIFEGIALATQTIGKCFQNGLVLIATPATI
jgi:hypothetical protein